MLFNSYSFFVFLVLVFAFYWAIPRKYVTIQNAFLLVVSYVFYGWWDWRFLFLIAFSTVVDYFLALGIENNALKRRRKLLLAISVAVNIGLLGFFKYYNFFIDNFVDAFATIDIQLHKSSLNIILPVGISFYTFQTLSYTIDVYREKLRPTKNFINFATYVAFFPQLVAGPIERATNLLPQFSQKRFFNDQKAISGVNLIIWGLFQKIVIADSCAPYVNAIFDDYQNMNSLSLMLGAFYFAFQIYGDFAGYSNIAIGTARLLGFDLMKNFNYPYFSRDIAEFWRRWHISLSTWFRDYVYIPLGGSRGSQWNQVRNVAIIFIVSAFWHGANWTFIFWGIFHAIFFVPILLLNLNRKHTNQVSEGKYLPTIRELLQMIFTFSLACFAWILFRAPSLGDAASYIKRMIINLDFSIDYLPNSRYTVEMILIILLFLVIEWFHRKYEHPFVGRWRWLKIVAVIFMLLTLGVYSNHQEFIYFQF